MDAPTVGQELRLQQWFLGLIAIGIALLILVMGRFFLVPLAIAVLLFSLMSAAIDRIAGARIGRFGIPNWFASLFSVTVIVAVMLFIFQLVAGQIDALVAAGPLYVARGQELVGTIFALLGDDMAAWILSAFEDIDVAAYIRAFAGSAGYILASMVLIVLYVGFLFTERTRFPRKLATLFPDPRRAGHVDLVFKSIARNVHRYILIKTVISVTTGLAVYLVLRAFELQFAETWALLAVFLNFIPNIGSIIATFIPTLVALAQFDGWTPVVLLFLSIGIIQFSVGNLIEPLLMGRSLHLSAFVIILSLTFWGAIWGVIGMFLAVPIMVMIMIVCSHVPTLHPIAVLLSRDGVPMPVEQTYEPRPARPASGPMPAPAQSAE